MRILFCLLIAVAVWSQSLPNAAPFAYNATPQFFGTDGKPLAGGKICTYQAGTTTPLATYTDATAGTSNDNPIILNSAGFPQKSGSVVGIFGGASSGLYKLVVRTAGSDGTCSTGTVVSSYDQIGDITLYFANYVTTAGTATLITYTNPQTGGTSETVAAKLEQTVSVLDFGAVCDGSTDDTTAITNAIAAAAATSKDLIFNGTSACISGAQTIGTTIHVRGPGTIKRKSGVSSALLTVTADNVVIDGLTIDGNSQGTSGGKVLYANGVANFTLKNADVRNNVAGEYAVLVNNTTGALLQGNTLTTSIIGPGIDVQNGSTRVRVASNIVNHAASSNGTLVGAGLGAHASSGTVSDVSFVGNTVYSAVGWCIEAAGIGGTVQQITIDGNTCSINNTTGSAACTATSGTIKPCGGYSFSVVSDSTMVGNTYNAASQVVDVASVEAYKCTRCILSNNTLVGAYDVTLSGSRGIWAVCAGCIVSGNIVNGWGSVAAINGIDFTMVSGFETDNQNVVTGNKVIYPASNVTNAGISFTCSLATGTPSMSQEVVSGNIVDGTAASGTISGINIVQTNGSCTMTGNSVTSNTVKSLANGLVFTSSLLNVVVGNTITSATNPIVCSSCTYATLIGPAASNTAGPGAVFANLASCGATITGAEASISDSNTNTWGANAAGGSSNNVKVRCNGSNWTVVGK